MKPPQRLRRSLAGRVAAFALLVGSVGVLAALLLHAWLDNMALAGTVALVLVLLLSMLGGRRLLRNHLSMFRALAGTVNSYRDGDFSFGLAWQAQDELAELVQAHNQLGATLRAQRLGLAQRELLLDTMVQNTPVAMVLVAEDSVVYGNLAARKLFFGGRKLEGQSLTALVAQTSPALQEAIERGGDGLFSFGADDQEEIYHLARRGFQLNARRHQLLMFRQLTQELRRQEVQTWKKVIRVISHELNNSLAPIASLAHSGAELLRRGQSERLSDLFATIEERARHLEGFIQGYARFAKLPTPHPETVDWQGFMAHLATQVGFVLGAPLPLTPARFDAAQLEQALLNLLKNAHESGSAPNAIALTVRMSPELVRIDIVDQGPGMTATVLANALVPFYSTKRSGTGLGLALAREIVEAHGGRIALANRDGGGLQVSLILPNTRSAL
jgi:nitrogen fixation/metabolism regulation signal transduction histidine kinase